MKNKKEKSESKATFKDALLELGLEIAIGLVTFVVGAVILNLISPDLLDGELDFVMFFGMIVLVAVSCFVAIPIWLIKKHRKPKDIKRIYKLLTQKYALELVMRNKKIDGVYKELYVIKGHSDEGMFELYKNGDGYIFTVEYFRLPVDEKIKTESLLTEADAIECIEKFMEKKSEKNETNN